MKTILLSLGLLITAAASSQALLNEMYTDPGSGKQEFFELYNTSTSSTPENLDGYALLTYYVESGKTGFYVYDLPSVSISAHGYFVAASSLIFNVQGQSNITANVSWNTLSLTGSMTKWERSGSSYIQRGLLTLNDFFVNCGGGSAEQHMFLYKNGVLINAFFGGTSQEVIPSYIKLMPPLFIDMAGTTPDFTATFSTLTDAQAEYVTPVPGSDNGYIRNRDGKCGAWQKSSSSKQHTPGISNGSASGAAGELTVTSNITFGAQLSDPSYLNYNITAGPADIFPITVEAYRDRGVIGQLDAGDILFDTRVIQNTTSGVQTIILPNMYEQVMLVFKTAAGCFDKVVAVANYRAVLTVQFDSFTAQRINDNAEIKWSTGSAINVDHYVVERSVDGMSFRTVATVAVQGRADGKSEYQYSDPITENSKYVYYRVRSVDNNDKSHFSETRMVRGNETKPSDEIFIQAYPNPAVSTLKIVGPAAWQGKKMTVDIYYATGAIAKHIEQQGSLKSETINISGLAKGFYIVKATCNNQTAQLRIIKQ